MNWISVDKLPIYTDIYKVKTDKGKTFKCWLLCDLHGNKTWGTAAKGRVITHWMPAKVKM